MNRKEFLKKLIEAYELSFYNFSKMGDKTPKQGVVDKYLSALPEEHPYYKEAFDLMMKKNLEAKAPEPAMILLWLREATPSQSYKAPKYNPEPIPQKCREEIERIRQKIYGGGQYV
jgi:hypothetical protein